MNVIEFKDTKSNPDIIHDYDDRYKNAVIIIDNGSSYCRVGWSNRKDPSLIFRNVIAKLRKDRFRKDMPENSATPQMQVGNDILNIEALRGQLKSPFDRNVVTQYETERYIFDYIFTHLGINHQNSVPHPVVLTEAFLNPNSCRSLMTELLFERYKVHSLAYGVDCLFTYHFFNKLANDALIVNLGYNTIHVIPVINNCTIFDNARRINIGGHQVLTFLQKILQLKYPAHSPFITLSRMEELLHYFCSVALDYKEELIKWTNTEYFNDNVLKVQLPYNVPAASAVSVEQQRERKKELAKRLSEINARKREERLAEDEARLQQLISIQNTIDVENSEKMEKLYAKYGVKNIDDLHKNIALLTMKIAKVKEKITASNTSEEIVNEEPPVKHKMVFEDENARQLFLENAKKMRQEIINKKTSRKIRRHDMVKRRTVAGQERMRIISQLARKEKGNDDFGLRDEDWDIYKTISKEGNDSDSDGETEKLMELEEVIKSYDTEATEHSSTPGESYQLYIGLERYRAPELLFKPYMIGSHEAGLSEVISYVLSLFNAEDQLKLAANVVLIGSIATLPGLKERLQSDLISVRPFQSYSNVEIISENSLSAWHGAKLWAKSPISNSSFVSKKQYEEFGYEYLKTHIASNLYQPSPKQTQLDTCE